MTSLILTLAHLPVVAQHLIATDGDPQRRMLLAASPTTAPQVVEQLTADDDRIVEHTALRLARSAELLADRFNVSNDCCKVAITRNLNTPGHILRLAAESASPKLRLAAYVNPSTPKEVRSDLDVKTAVELSEVGSFLGARVVRSHEIVNMNRHLLEDPVLLTPMFRRAALALWDITSEQLAAYSSKGNSRYVKRHPLRFSPKGVADLSVEELLGMRSPAADLYLSEHATTDAVTARSMLSRVGYHNEPQIIGRLLRRFGLEAIPEQTPGHSRRLVIADTRTASGSWYDPLVQHYNTLLAERDAVHPTVVAAVLDKLGQDAEAWTTFIRLESQWEGTMDELARAAQTL
jgi:hypothetical protein